MSSLESPLSILFDSNGIEMAHSQSQVITGSTTGYLVMGSGSTGAQFLKVGPDGEVFITGSIDAVAAGVQQVTGVVNIGNIWSAITGTNNALVVNQGQSGSIQQSWYMSLTDGTKVIGTGSSAPLYVNVVNAITTSANNATTTAVSQVLASTTPYNVLTSNSSRKGTSFYKEGSGNAYILLGAGVPSATNFTVKLLNGASYDTPFNYTGPVQVVFSTHVAGSYIMVTDFTW